LVGDRKLSYTRNRTENLTTKSFSETNLFSFVVGHRFFTFRKNDIQNCKREFLGQAVKAGEQKIYRHSNSESCKRVD